MIQQKPKIYQRKGTRLTAVAGDYVITGKEEVGFRLGNYDPRAAVVIDPVLRYSTFLGGGSSDEGTGIAVDSSNRAVVVGTTCSPDFPVPANTQPNQACSVFVTKFDFTGSHLFFSTFIGEVALARRWPWMPQTTFTLPGRLFRIASQLPRGHSKQPLGATQTRLSAN